MLLFLASSAACGGSAAPGPDAAPAAATLEILEPGDSLGMAFGQRVTLAVRYRGPGGLPVAGVRVSFAIVADLPNESAAGASLSAVGGDSDATGRASVDLVAGAARSAFRVRAQAAGASTQFFTVTVGEEGFVDLEVELLHAGSAPVANPRVQLYRGDVRCATLSPAAPPSSPYPPRMLATLQSVARYSALPPDDAYAILTWAGPSDGRVTAQGCVDLGPRQLRPGGGVIVFVPLVDQPIEPAMTYDVTSTFDLSPLRLLFTGETTAWGRASCPLGAAQLFLDCAIDLLDAGDPADCRIESPGTTAAALLAARGTVDADGCRPATAGGTTSLDALLMGGLGSGAATAAVLPGAARTLADLLDSLALDSTMDVAPAAVVQRLGLATLEADGIRYDVDLRTTIHPIVAAVAPVGRSLPGDEIVIATLPYTLRLGELVDDAFFSHTGLPGKAGGIGSLLVPSNECTKVSSLVCGPANLPSDCLRAACLAARPVLDDQLADPFVSLSGTNLDFLVDGSAVLSDTNGDLVAEQLKGGTWDATARLASGEEISLFGVFQGSAR